MFTRAEIPKWQALSLFDKYRTETPEVFRRILEDHEWYQAYVPGSARIFMRADVPLVFKLCDESIFWQGYDAFARRLRQPDVLPSEYPNLPHIYRYRRDIALVGRCEHVALEQAEQWYGVVMALYRYPDPEKAPQDVSDMLAEYRRSYPYLDKAIRLIRGVAVGHAFKFNLKAIDILAGECGPVLLDPLH